MVAPSESPCNAELLLNSTGIVDSSALAKAISCVMGDTTAQSDNAMTILRQHIIPAYSDATSTMVLMNTSYNNSAYVRDDINTRKLEMERMSQSTRNNIHKVRYTYMQKRRQAAYYTFMSGVMQSLIVIVSLSAVLASMYKLGLLSPKMLAAGVMTMVLLFLLVIAVIIKNNLTRRPDDWHKFYFAPNNPSV